MIRYHEGTNSGNLTLQLQNQYYRVRHAGLSSIVNRKIERNRSLSVRLGHRANLGEASDNTAQRNQSRGISGPVSVATKVCHFVVNHSIKRLI